MIDVNRKTKVVPLTICDPLDDRCIAPIEPSMRPGISVRHSPACNGDLCSLFACNGGNWRITREGTLDRSQWIKGWVFTQLTTRALVDCDEHPLGERSGGWWADSFRAGTESAGFVSGSKLWALQFAHGGATNDLLLRAQDYAQEALSYLTSSGIAARVDVHAMYIARGPLMGRGDRNTPPGAVIQLSVNVVGPGVQANLVLQGSQQPDWSWLWEEYRMPQPRTPGRHYTRAA